jgi:glycosyl transferase family 1
VGGTTYRFSANAPDPRVLCVSTRDIAPVISRSLRYEFEDLIGAMDAADVIAPADTPDPEAADTPMQNATRILRRLAAKIRRRLSVKLEGKLPFTGMRPLPSGLAHDYELLFVSLQSPTDLFALSPLAMWRSAARVSMCYIDELYVPDVSRLGSLLEILKRFDHILVPQRDTVRPLALATGRPCHYLAPSTDTLKMCPYPTGPERVIDFYAMGTSRPAATHKALLRMSETGDWYYMYDTVGNCRVDNHDEHRNRLADIIKRSRFFLVTAARWYDLDRTGGQQEVGLRYFEGAAGGAVLIGDVPHNDSFDQYFGWQDSVIPVSLESGDIADVVAELATDPRRLERISKTNVVNSLRRHDHLHRWSQILSAAGLKETAAMEARRRELEELAASIEQTIAE